MMLSKSAKLALGALAVSGVLAHGPASAQSVAVTSIVEHPALDAVKDGVKQALADAGYTEGKGLKWQFQTAQGNTAIAGQIARKYVGDKPD
ncbi:MAG: ABC transporter substrate binding protein, partial [Candidimonas sp.]